MLEQQRTVRLALQWVLACLSALLAIVVWHQAARLILPLVFAVEALFLLPPIFRRIYDVPGETWWNAGLLVAACAVALLSLSDLFLHAAESEHQLSYQSGNLAFLGVLTGLQSKANWPKILYTVLLLALLVVLTVLEGF